MMQTRSVLLDRKPSTKKKKKNLNAAFKSVVILKLTKQSTRNKRLTAKFNLKICWDNDKMAIWQ